MHSLFLPLDKEGLTTLRINYDWRTDALRLEAKKEWDAGTEFSGYNRDFVCASILTEGGRTLGTAEVWELFRKYGQEEYLKSVVELIRKGRHFGIECFYHAKRDIRFMCNIHSWRLGLKNRQHATLSGGIRRHSPDEEEYDVIIDGLNLGRGSSFKAIAADVPYGGSKTTVTMAPLDLEDMESLGFIAYAIDRCRVHTGPDMNFPAEMADVMQEHFSMQFTGGPKDVLGPTGTPTAYGVYRTMKQAVRFAEGTESLDGKSVALMGLGAVGWFLGEYLGAEKVRLLISDINPERTQAFVEEHPELDVTVISSDEILYTEADILCPCSIGGIISEDVIPKLKCRYIWGAANNQLRASSQEEEYRLAAMLAERGILFQTEWFHNAAGLITGSEAYMLGKDATYDGLIRRIDNHLPQSTFANLTEAKKLGITPTENAYRHCESVIYGNGLY